MMSTFGVEDPPLGWSCVYDTLYQRWSRKEKKNIQDTCSTEAIVAKDRFRGSVSN